MPMKYNELVQKYIEKGYDLIKYGTVQELGRDFDLFKIILDVGSDKNFLITTGFHGEEFNGPISLLNFIDEIRDYAKERNVNLIIYICINPSGFELRQRANASGERPNNDVMRYELLDGRWVDILHPGEEFLRYKVIDSPAKEARLLQKDLEVSGLYKNIPLAVVDIHQDRDPFPGDYYAYIFGKRDVYRKIMEQVDKVGVRLLNTNTDSDGDIKFTTDDEGFIEVHDSALTDYFYHLGCPFSVTVETITKCSLDKVVKINETFIKSLIDEVAKIAVIETTETMPLSANQTEKAS